ncbi:DNA replication and repair protein RecN [Longilinea arvoryzae]|uniref:DNA repair protein RecN n=1 Tax=Longilinea arvoryzae TaxID=360412 RepID=A0A0S7BF96_9CHLR|nr:DNA repair protein RecN [Longilinea arvoryzae]GAP12309.1 DNA replication and repair protein RecN [Longilinea arvoryzae]
MLIELRIDNFAIIQHLELDLGAGLLTFTGETGAGKSIILDAIMALVGGKADATSIRAGADRASLEAVFRIPASSRAEIQALLERENLLDEPDTVTLARELRREGRTVARINGRSVGLNLLRELGDYLVDIHGQAEHLSLLHVKSHLGLLDRYAGTEEALNAYRQTFHVLRGVQRDLVGLRQSEQDAARKTDLLNFQANEIEAANLQAGEEEELRQERTRLANAENLASLAQQSLAALDEGSPEALSAADLLGQVAQALSGLSRIDSSQQGLSDQAETLSEMASDLSRELHAYLENIEFNPRRLEQIEERLELIHNLKRKYGSDVQTVLDFAVRARAELETIAHAGERIAELEEQEDKLRQELAGLGWALSEQRRAAAGRLGEGVERELADLSMAGARFAVDIQFEPAGNGLILPDGRTVAFDESGLDRVEFLIAPNPGEGLKPLVKIASGGETSRLMLALKNVLAQADYIPTLIFDEIDQGIGGRVGTVVGEKLWQLGRQHQVLVVTHLPQLAAFGDRHYRVSKHVQNERTTTQVEKLSQRTREEELAQMLGGVSEANLHAAQEALALANQYASQPDHKIP